MAADPKAKQPVTVAMHDRSTRHHLTVEQRPPCQDTVKRPAMPVGPVHHWCDGKDLMSVFWIVVIHAEGITSSLNAKQ